MTIADTPRVRLTDIAGCFEGVVPSPICTCSADGMPNVTYLSIVHLIDDAHVGLSVQFFNKTRRNVLENPRAQVILVEPDTIDQYRLDLEFERTEASGPLFDAVNVKLEAIASHGGLRDIFKLRGVDVYRVIDCRPVVPGVAPAARQRREDVLLKVAEFSGALAAARDLESILQTGLEQLSRVFGYDHAFVMVPDEEGRVLFTVASRGFTTSGIGSEVPIGEGLIGLAAAKRTSMRSTNLARERVLQRIIRAELTRAGDAGLMDREIPLPGLANAASQLVVPLEARGELIGVLCIQSATPGRFLAADEPTIQILGRQLAASMALAGATAANPDAAAAGPPRPSLPDPQGVSQVRYYPADDSVFIDDAYVIKGVPGRILRRLLDLQRSTGRDEFSNRELRLDPSLKLPEFQDNLEARLVLLRKRLEERTDAIRLERAGRGRMRLVLGRAIALQVVDAST